VTFTPDLQFEMSRCIKEEFNNGRHYYELHGKSIFAPVDAMRRPDPGRCTGTTNMLFEGEVAMRDDALDPSMRMAAFEHVQRLGEIHDHLTATELKPSLVFQGQ
jgi:hypothetical protein